MFRLGPARYWFTRSATKLYKQLFGRPEFYRFNRLLYLLSSRAIGLRNCDAVDSGEARMLERLEISTESPCVVDAGAHNGFYAELVCKSFSGARVIALEPNPLTFRRLEQSAERHGFTALNVALGSAAGTMQLFDKPDRDGSALASSCSEAFGILYGVNGVGLAHWDVPVKTLDDLAVEYSLDRIDLLKLDIEGHETMALAGARRLIAEGRVDRVQFETSLIQAIRNIPFQAFLDALPGYTFFRVLPSGLLPIERTRWEDAEMPYIAQNWLAVREGISGTSRR